MEVKPGYKQTEVGLIPEEWDLSLLGDCCALITKGTTPTSLGKKFVKSGVHFLKAESISEAGTTIREKVAFIDDATHALLKRSQLTSGDLLISIAGVLGRIGLVRESDVPANTNQALAIVRLGNRSALDRTYLFYNLRSPFIAKQIRDINVQAAQANISLQNVRDFRIPHPSIVEEQRAIVEALSDVDGLLSGLDRLIAKKHDLKQAAMQQLLTGKTRLPGFHDKWEVKTFGELFKFSGGYSATRDQLSSEGHCYLHYGDIHGATKTTVDVRADYQNIPKLDIPLKRVAAKSLLEDGDVVFVDASEDDEGTSRHVVVINKENKPFVSGLHTIVAKSKTDELAHEYRRYCFQTAAIRQQFLFYAVGTKVSGISKTNIAKLKMHVPKVPEQTAIAEVLSDMDAELAGLERRREKIRALKQAMMQELLTGRIRLS